MKKLVHVCLWVSIISFLLLAANISVAQKAKAVAPIGHANKGDKVVFTQDGKIMISGDLNGVLKWWDIETGKLLHTSVQAKEWLKDMKVSPDNRWLACALDNGQVNIWSIRDGSLYMQINAHSLYVQSLSFSPDSKLLATISSNEDSVAIWSIAQKNLLKKWDIGSAGLQVAFVEGTNRLAIKTISPTDKLEVWDWKTEKRILSLPSEFTQLAGTPMVAAWKRDSIFLYNLANGKREKVFLAKDTLVHKAIFCGNQYILYVGADLVLHKLDLKTGQELFGLPCPLKKEKANQILLASFVANQQGSFCIISDFDGNGLIVDAVHGKIAKKLPKLDNYANYYDAKFSKQGNRLAIPGPIWEAATLFELPELKESVYGESLAVPTTTALLLPNHLLIAANDTIVSAFDIAKNQMVWTCKNVGWNTNINALSDHDRFWVRWSKDSLIQIYDLREGLLSAEIAKTIGLPKWANTTNDGKLLLVVFDKNIIVYNVMDRNPICSIPILKDREEIAQITLDGTRLLWMDIQGWFKTFEIPSGKILDSVFIGTNRYPRGVVLSPDGNKVAVNWQSNGEAFSNVSILDIATGKILWEITDHYAWLEVIEFSPDGQKMIFTSMKGGDAEIRDAASGKVIGSVRVRSQITDGGFLKQGKYFFTKEMDGHIIVWDTQSLLPKYETDGIASFCKGVNDSMLIAITQENGVGFFESGSFRELASFVRMSNNEWFATSPNGLFDMSSGLGSKLHFVLNDPSNNTEPWSILEFKQLKERYFQPGLLPVLFGHSKEALRLVPPLGRTQFPPRTQVELHKNNLQIMVRDAGGGCGKVSLFIDKIEVTENLLDSTAWVERVADTVKVFVDLNRYARYLAVDTTNEISVVSWNSDKWLSAMPVSLLYKQQAEKGQTVKLGKMEAKKPMLYALIVGTSDYAGDELDLNYAAKDARDFATAIELAATKLFGAKETHVFLLNTDADQDSLQPSRVNIDKYLKILSERINPQDIFLLYFSGHGVNFGGQDGDFYYLTKNASGAEANYLQDPAIRNAVAISSFELTTMLNTIVARKKVLILDACASGRAAETISLAMRDVPASQTRALDRMADRTGFYVLSGSAANAVSYESGMFGQGLLTYSLLKGIRGAALRTDGNEEYVDVARLMQFAVDEVPQLARHIGGVQKPLYRSPDDQQSYDLGRVDDSVKREIKLATPKPIIMTASFLNTLENEDNIGLTEQVNAQLREITAKGRDAELLLTEAKSFPGAWKLTGSYKINENKIVIDYRLRRDEMKYDKSLTLPLDTISNLSIKLVEEVKRQVQL